MPPEGFPSNSNLNLLSLPILIRKSAFNAPSGNTCY